VWGNVLPGVVNVGNHIQSKPDQNMDGDHKKSGLITGWFLHYLEFACKDNRNQKVNQPF